MESRTWCSQLTGLITGTSMADIAVVVDLGVLRCCLRLVKVLLRRPVRGITG
ncbi:MAG TPA: hypothetical protein VJ351_19730 [Streptosporangiaceae bacterium]|nr:hypothetical protein [Streptosporangiaceae bacterium]